MTGSLGVTVHGPLEATSREQIGQGYSCGVVKVTSSDGSVNITIFTPSGATAKAIAYAINATWPVAAEKSSVAA